jgi:capsular exopolysaccharide synthesis family protein
MLEEHKDKLITSEAEALDLRRDYHYGQGLAVEDEETHLRDYWRIIRRRLWVPLSVVFITVTLTTIYMLRTPDIYQGGTTIQIDQDDRSVFSFKELNIHMGDDGQYLNTQLRNLRSPTIAAKVVKQLDLEHDDQFIPRSSRSAGEQPQTLQVTRGESDEQIAQAEIARLEEYTNVLLSNVEVERLRDTRLVQIRYRHTQPELARRIADAWADVFITHTLEGRRAGTKQSDAFLQTRIGEVKLQLREAEGKLFDYRSSSPVLDFSEKENTVQARYANLNQLLLNAEHERKNLQVAYEASRKASDPTAIPEIQQDLTVQDLTKKLTELKQEKAKLEVEFTPEWPEVKTVNERLAQLAGLLEAAYARILNRIEVQYQSALKREELLRQAVNEQRGETRQQNLGAIQMKVLQQEVDTNRALLDKLLNSQKEVEISLAAIKPNMRITEYSPLPRVPVAPKRGQNILLSLFLSLVGGVSLVLFLDYINNKIESVEDIDRYLRLPALGVVPAFSSGKARKLLSQTAASTSKELQPVGLNGYAGAMILTEVESTSSIAESYRQLRTAVLLSSAAHAPRTILITSSQPAEGKTTTSVNMAISLAQTGAAVLIVDADLRRPRVHKIFGLKNSRGLCNYLAGECDLASLVQVALPNLYVLPVGPLPPNPAELLGSPKMRQVVETLAGNFDYVVIDSPPVASFADSLILSSLVEGVIIVVKAGATAREMAQRTKAHLQSVGAKILGVVINQIKLQPHDYYYYSTYYSRYYYQDHDEVKETSPEPEGQKAQAKEA